MSRLVETMMRALARWVTYHLALGAGLGVAGAVLVVLIVVTSHPRVRARQDRKWSRR